MANAHPVDKIHIFKRFGRWWCDWGSYTASFPTRPELVEWATTTFEGRRKNPNEQ